jgi:hypothetical protein
MALVRLHQPHHPNTDVPDELEPGALPIEPDEGPVPAFIPDDPEHDRVISPTAILAGQAQRDWRQEEVARCH